MGLAPRRFVAVSPGPNGII